MPTTIHIGLVEDQHLFRQSLRSNLETTEDLRVVFESADGYSVISRLREQSPLPDVMLVDLSLPPNGHQEYSGLDLTRDLSREFPKVAILILTIHQDPYFISKLIETGASGYLVKDTSLSEVYEAIRSVHHNGSYINQQSLQAIQGRLQGRTRPKHTSEALSKRELDVLRLICQQLTTEEIAEKLFISPKTVDGHRSNLMQKTGSRNVTGLVLYAIKKKLVELV